MQIKDLTGEKIGRLTVLRRIEDYYYPSGRHDVRYACKCDCGSEINVLGIHLRSGHTLSCGCLRAEKARNKMLKHGMTNTRIHVIWKNMLSRCFNESRPDYPLYGGRGITVCEAWEKSFDAFYAWAMGNGYNDTLTLDRINVNGIYSPENCRWVTQKEQCNNTRRNIVVNYNNETHTLKEWCTILGLNYGTISSRVKRGWSPEDALTTPVRIISEHN